MSHFSVAVIGEDIEGQLQPYYDYESTGYKDEYVELWEIQPEDLAYGNERYEDAVCRYREQVAAKDLKDGKDPKDIKPFMTKDEYYVYHMCWEKGDCGEWCILTNPHSRWDWWTIGGRWPGFFTVRRTPEDKHYSSPLLVDSAKIEDIDFIGPRMQAEIKAAEIFDAFNTHMEGIPNNSMTMAEISDRHILPLGFEPIDFDSSITTEVYKKYREDFEKAQKAARTEYDNQPWQLALQDFSQKHNLHIYPNSIDTYFCLDEPDPKLSFISRESSGYGVPCAYLYSGQWFDKEDFNDQYEYELSFWRAIDTSKPGTIITIVDCHC